jgi:two-component system LytT family sensor kinase
VNESLLVNTLGHSAGVLIFGIFLYLLIQDRAARRLRGSRKSMLAAALALAWNLASLLVLGSQTANSEWTQITVAVGFSVLSLLPAVLLDLCLEDRFRWISHAGYALSVVSIAFHVAELFRQEVPYHRLGLLMITVGYGSLTCAAAAGILLSRDEQRRSITSRLVGTMLLFLLAMSFVHLGEGHVDQIWSHELAFHHAAIPLALLLLLQDYRFVMVDAFLRFLTNVLLAALFTFGAIEAWRALPQRAEPFYEALTLAGACLMLIVFAVLRGWVQKQLTRLVFRRPHSDALLNRLRVPIHDERSYIALAAAELGVFMGVDSSADGDPLFLTLDLHEPVLVSELQQHRDVLERRGIEVIAPLRSMSGGGTHILLGRRSGGRRYLSEDLQALTRACSFIVEQVDQFRESELRRLVSQAELRALQSQIHPHFLFNALNTLYGIIPREAKGARETVLNLADILRYFLETGKTFLPLEQELRIITAYLDVERLRLGEKLSIEIDVDPEALRLPIPMLSIEPLVENAVKHGVSMKANGGLVRLEAKVVSGSLRISVSDTGLGFSKRTGPGNGGGVGMENVTRRLELCYGAEATLHIESDSNGSRVSFTIPAGVPSSAARALEPVQ